MMEYQALPKGWRREEIIRKNGLSCGKIDVYYYSPSGKKFRTKPQLARYLGDSVDLTSFDYRTGKINSLLLRKGKKMKNAVFESMRDLKGNDSSLLPPIRQTASIFKQPVTIIKTQPESKARNDIKHGTTEKPKQVFWEKRLERLRATNADTEMYESFDLPKSMRPVGPNINGETALRSISTALHLHSQSITGQTAAKVDLEKNPGAYVNTGQPLISAIIITDEEIKNQEERVYQARKRLEKAINKMES